MSSSPPPKRARLGPSSDSGSASDSDSGSGSGGSSPSPPATVRKSRPSSSPLPTPVGRQAAIRATPPSARRKPAAPQRQATGMRPPAAAAGAGATPQRRRFRPGARALREIRLMQQSTSLLIRKLPFARLVREIQMEFTGRAFRWQAEALLALQEAVEAYLVRTFEDAYVALDEWGWCISRIMDGRILTAWLVVTGTCARSTPSA